MSNARAPGNATGLQIRKLVPASPERVFSAWTDPDSLKEWWGPRDVRCLSAEVELRVGGRYRIENELPDGAILWIAGEFEVVEQPHRLVYTWIVETENPRTERVSVRFEQHEAGTEIVLTHELISSLALRDQHQHGWIGCLEGLVEHITDTTAPNIRV